MYVQGKGFRQRLPTAATQPESRSLQGTHGQKLTCWVLETHLDGLDVTYFFFYCDRGQLQN